MDNGQWVEEAATIGKAKDYMTAMRVKKSLFKACPSGNILHSVPSNILSDRKAVLTAKRGQNTHLRGLLG